MSNNSNNRVDRVLDAIRVLRDEGIVRFKPNGEEMKAELSVHTAAGFHNKRKHILVCAFKEPEPGDSIQITRMLCLESEEGYDFAEQILAGENAGQAAAD